MVALFCSYGSPSSRPVADLAPVIFQPRQRISTFPTPANPDIGLFFTREKFYDVVDRVSNFYSMHGQAFAISQYLKDYVWTMTWGHPAAVRTLLDTLASSPVSTLTFSDTLRGH
jgi:hypothetical protein